MLRIFEQIDLRRAGFGSPEHLHALIEAKKLAFADRARFYADPHFAPDPAALLSEDYARRRRALIRDERALAAVAAGNPALCHGDTVYFAAADSDRNMVSLIQSNFHGFVRGSARQALASACRIGGSCSTGRRAAPTPTLPANGRSTRSFRRSSPARADR